MLAAMNENESIAAIRIIGAVARADGAVTDDEKTAFRAAVAEFNPKLPDGTDLERLLAEESDLDADLAAVSSPVLRRAVFDTAIAMSLIDGATSADENAVLARIRAAFATSGETSVLERTLERRQKLVSANPILDPEERNRRVRELIASRALWAGVFGALPIPVVCDIGVLIQIDSLVEAVALTWGHPLTRKERLARFGAVISVAMAQSAVHSLLKLIPGWGSVAGAVGGSLAAFVVTHAVGSAVQYHFEHEGKTTAAELKKVFAEKKVEAKQSYEAQKGTIERVKDKHADEIQKLSAQLEKDEITVEEFDQKVAELVNREKRA
jgi:uncharacterized protein (DUF697 family)